MYLVSMCRTGKLVYDIEQCEACGHTKRHCNSCGDRNCPRAAITYCSTCHGYVQNWQNQQKKKVESKELKQQSFEFADWSITLFIADYWNNEINGNYPSYYTEGQRFHTVTRRVILKLHCIDSNKLLGFFNQKTGQFARLGLYEKTNTYIENSWMMAKLLHDFLADHCLRKQALN